MDTPAKILVIRNDKIGDFMLSWPSFALLKNQYPNAEITALVPEYTAELANKCIWIDNVLIDKKSESFTGDISQLTKKIKSNDYDASISLYSEFRTAISLWLSGIKVRVGPATKIAQLFLNKTLRQKRSKSLKPEYEYNIDLVKYYINLNRDSIANSAQQPYLTFKIDEINSLRRSIIEKYNIAEGSNIIEIHPGTGGSAINLSLEQYAKLAKIIAQNMQTYFIITAGPGETDIAEKLSNLINGTNHHVHTSTSGIIDFCKLINICDVFISGSTGPLHIAGALDVCTAAFYPARRSATSLRWQTLNSKNNRISFSPETFTGENDMKQIDINNAAASIINKFLLQ